METVPNEGMPNFGYSGIGDKNRDYRLKNGAGRIKKRLPNKGRKKDSVFVGHVDINNSRIKTEFLCEEDEAIYEYCNENLAASLAGSVVIDVLTVESFDNMLSLHLISFVISSYCTS